MAEQGGGSRFAIRHWPVRWRLAGVSAGLTLLILVVFALVVGRLASDKIVDDFDDELRNTASELRTQFQLNALQIDAPVRRDILDLVMAGDAGFRVVDAEGHVVNGVETGGVPDLGPPDTGSLKVVGGFEVAALPLSPNAIPPTYLQYARSRASVDDTLSKLWLFLFGGVAGGTFLALLAGLAVANRAMRPISSLTAAAREIAATRDPSTRLPMPESEDEVAELAQTLDQMLRQLDAARSETEQMIQAQRDFVADASHELRTPLTSILANLELLEASFAARGADADEEEIVAGALGSSRRMRRLVGDLLLLARADAGRTGPRRSCDLSAIAATAIAEVLPVAEGHTIELDAPQPVAVDGNPDDLHRLVVNLVENGVRHTPRGCTIAVAVTAGDDGEALLSVSDDGPGLPEGVGDQIFARFVRGTGPADLSSSSGTGLGLAIVKAVAESHHGRVEVGSSPAGGARFAVHLPLGEPASEPASTF
jgi:signal transduction histidine kinase